MVADDHFHPESLSEFIAALDSAGFRVLDGSSLPTWRGPIHPAFGSLTDAQTMDVVIAPGWPFQPPAVFVQGLNTNRFNPRGSGVHVAGRRLQPRLDHRRGSFLEDRRMVQEGETWVGGRSP